MNIFRYMWTPDVVFENQVSLERAVSTIKNKSDAVVEVLVLDCSSNDLKLLCKKLGISDVSKRKKIMVKQTTRIEVNCPQMDFQNFPFDDQLCDFIPTSLMSGAIKDSGFRWKLFQLVQGNNLTSTEFDLRVSKIANINRNETRVGFRVEMARKTPVYIYTYFVPCGLMVVVSWISFSVKVDAVPGR